MTVKNRLAKGKRIELLARRALEAQGHRVESAPNVVRWIKPHGVGEGVWKLRPISSRHDFFGAWDAVSRYHPKLFATQWWSITVFEHEADKRKFLQNDPLWRNYPFGAVLSYVGGSKNRHFRVLRGGDGYEWKGETLMVAR